MNIEHLRLFVRVAALQNISSAGKELGLSAAVSSSHLNKLEEDLGVRLLHRTTRRVSLTEDGTALLPHASDLLEKVEMVRASVGSGTMSPQGKLRIAAPASFGRLQLVPAMSEFLSLHPQLDVDMHLSDSVIDMVEGGFDVAIREASLQDSSLVARKLATTHRIVCASPDYLAQHGEPNTPEEIQEHHCVNLIGLENWSFITAEGVQKIRTRNRLRTDNGESARDAAAAGLGLTISSTWCCHRELERGELVQVLKEFPLESNVAIWAVYPSSRMLAPKVRAFIDHFADRFGTNPPWELMA